jgi:hypothetical protein
MHTNDHFLLPRCTGMNCGATDENHSPECRAEHAAAVAGGRFVKAAALSARADGGKDSSDAEPVGKSDVRPKERLCGGSHISCNGVDYCLGHPSCRDIAKERAEKEKK